MAGNTKRMRAQKNFLGSEREGFIRKGQAFDTSPAAAQMYVNQGLAVEMPGRPSKADAEAATAADKAAKATESKESTAKGASGLEPWSLSISEEAYVAKYDGNSDTPSVLENLKLAKARIKAGVSQGAQG